MTAKELSDLETTLGDIIEDASALLAVLGAVKPVNVKDMARLRADLKDALMYSTSVSSALAEALNATREK